MIGDRPEQPHTDTLFLASLYFFLSAGGKVNQKKPDRWTQIINFEGDNKLQR